MDLSRDECVTLRDRMRARASSGMGLGERSSSASSGEHHGPLSSNEPLRSLSQTGANTVGGSTKTQSPSRRPLYSPPRHLDRPSSAAPTGTALASVDQCRSLKERVYDRACGTSGLNTTASRRDPYHGLPEATKDVYVHEQPFPVGAVYEVERVRPSQHLSPSKRPQSGSAGGSESLLMPEEAAKLVKSLEDRHTHNLQRIASLENQLLTLQSESERDSLQVRDLEHQNTELVTRNNELERQLALVRGESRDVIEVNNRQNDRVVATAVEENNKKWRSLEKGLEIDLQSTRKELEHMTRSKLEMERLVKELKEQLAQNAGALQTSNETVRDLTKQLVAAKNQSSSVSNGYRELEKQLKTTNSLCASQKSELDALRNVHTELVAEREQRKRQEDELERTTKKLEVWKQAEQERQRLEQLTKMQAAEMDSKQKELQKLKEQLDSIKDQAHTAFLQSGQFHRMAGAGGYGGADDPMALLRREIEDEERRTSDESRRWRNKLSSPVKY